MKNNMTMKYMHNKTNRLRKALLRSLALAALIVMGMGNAWATDYVIYQNGYFLSHDGSGNLSAVSTFNATNCIWTGTDGTSTTLTNQNYSLYSSYSSLRAYNGYSTTYTISNNSVYYYNNYGYYCYFTLSSSGVSATYGSSAPTSSAGIYTITEVTAGLSIPGITGNSRITQTGTYTYSASATYSTSSYYKLEGASTLYCTAGGSASATVPAGGSSDGITYSYSLSSNSYATVNATTGVITVTGIPESDETITLTVTASKTGQTSTTAEKTITLSPNNYTSESAGYVLLSNGSYLYNNNGNVGATTTFAPTTCIWAGTLTGTLSNQSKYLNDNNGTLSLGNSGTTTWQSYATESGNTGGKLYTGSRYLQFQNNTTWRTSGQSSNAASCYFAVTKYTYDEEAIAPTITGDDEFTSTGNKNYSHTDAAYKMGYYNYVFYNNTNHFFKSDNTTSLTAAPTAETFTYEWSLSNDGDGHVSIISSTGVISYSNIYTTDTYGTLTLTATSANKTYTVTKQILFRSKLPTTLTFAESAPSISGTTGIQLPTVTLKDNNGAAMSGTITYSSEGCDVSSTGVVTNITGTSATVTASYDGTTTYAASSATYTITATSHAALNKSTCSDITISPTSATLASGTQDYSVPTSVTAETRTQDAYTEYSFPVGKLYKLTDGTISDSAPTVNITTGQTLNFDHVNWSMETEAGSYVTLDPYYSASSPTMTLKRGTQLTAENRTYTITATVGYGAYGSVTTTATATVTIPYTEVDLTAIHLTSSNMTLAVGESDQITYTYEPNYDAAGRTHVEMVYTIAEGGDSYISVDANGNVTGLAEGTTSITMTPKKIDGTSNTALAVTISVEVSNGTGTATDPFKISSVAGLNKIANNLSSCFIVTADFDASTFNTAITGFSGTLDGDFHKITGLTKPLFNSTDGATIKNVILDNVNLTSSVTVNSTTCLGAIAAYATGSTKIYNCGVQASGSTFDENGNLVTNSSTISGGANTGSLVGYIPAGANVRVVNNYSYANVSNSGYSGGIVGRNDGTALTKDNIANSSHVAITNNMFYGNLTGSTSYTSPVYAGNHTSNVQNVNEYNYWRSHADVQYANYNNQLAIDKDAYLNRFPFYRHIQNTHRELAALYLFGSISDANVAEIGHWYNEKTVAGQTNTRPYPIIEKWETSTKKTTEDINDNLPATSDTYAGKLLTDMGTSGYLRVNYTINGTTGHLDLPITDMDTLNYDFTWGKVVLPFVNEISGWTAPTTSTTDYGKICTGWKITSVTGGTAGTLTNYNFADRDCTAKDLYSNSGFIFAQGGNYIVPYGVTAIDVEANFANAYYLSDATYDIGYNASYGGATGIGGNVATPYNGKTVYTSLSTLMGKMATDVNTPHTQAIVLVGNYHYNQNVVGEVFNSYLTSGLTIMSIDKDNNQEPDYGMYTYFYTSSNTSGRTNIPVMRFDFVPNIGIGMAARVTESTMYPTIGIWHGRGWFELTETCVSIMSECEINDQNFTKTDHSMTRWIANSGYFIQIVRARDGNCSGLNYMQIGGNAYVEQLYPGPHMAQTYSIALCPINVTGGEILQCFMTGRGQNSNAVATGDNIYFWCAGGRIHKYLSAFMVVPSSTNCNVTAKVDHARIYRFFGGGTSNTARITGNINITMNNSLVDFYCGGPEFGNMNSGKTVTTNATGSTFGEFYGAGYGGTAITQRNTVDKTQGFDNDVTYPAAWSNYTNNRLSYQSGYGGFGSSYEFEFILYAGGHGSGVYRFYVGYADFSLAQTGNVTSILNNCNVGYYDKTGTLRGGDFFGGGCQGRVAGTATSSLSNCQVIGSAFGGGYKPASSTVYIYPTTQPTYSKYTKETGLFSDFGTVEPDEFTWQQGTAGQKDETNKVLYTNVDMTTSGQVTGAIEINVNGGTVGGDVFGGGNESSSLNTTTVNIADNAQITGSVFGGANKADVGNTTDCSATTVNVTSGNMSNVFGANNLSGKKMGTITVNVTKEDGATKTLQIGNVYGGGNLAAYSVYGYNNDGSVKTTGTACDDPQVLVNSGNITESVFGGGLGESAMMVGNPQVRIGKADCTSCTVQVGGSVYGGGSAAPVTGNPYVQTNGKNNGGVTINNYVFGGGWGANAVVTGNTKVEILGNTRVNKNVYGGGHGGDVTGNTHVIIGE